MSCDCVTILKYTEGDLLPYLYLEWKDSGSIVGYSFNLHVRRADGTRFTRAAIIDDNGTISGSGAFHFEWEPGDLIRGRMEAEIEVWNPAGKNETWPGLLIDVSGDIA